jgi:hypothetical protein
MAPMILGPFSRFAKSTKPNPFAKFRSAKPALREDELARAQATEAKAEAELTASIQESFFAPLTAASTSMGKPSRSFVCARMIDSFGGVGCAVAR